MLLRPKFLLFALLALTAAACGLKGPLYRPDEARDETVTPSSDSAGSPRKKDNASGIPAGEQGGPPVSPPDPDRPIVPPER